MTPSTRRDLQSKILDNVRAVAAWLRVIRDRGFDVAAVLRRLQVARYVPVNRAAGRRARDAYLSETRWPRFGEPGFVAQEVMY